MMRRQILAAVRVLLVFTLLLGVLYPLAVTGVARLAFPEKANGSLVRLGDRVVGSSLLCQPFPGPEWFHGRADVCDPAASGAANLGPSSASLAQQTRAALEEVRAAGALGPIPADAVSGSGSGLDPHISPEHARLQVPGVAAARGLPEDEVLNLVELLTEGRTLGFLGEPRVNVLLLNLALLGLQP